MRRTKEDTAHTRNKLLSHVHFVNRRLLFGSVVHNDFLVYIIIDVAI